MPIKHKIDAIVTISKLMKEIDNMLANTMDRKPQGAAAN
jgi:hypothetical protein